MKKILSIVLSAMVCLCFAGCDFLSGLWKGYVPPSNGPTPLTYYGVIEEQEESGALFVYIDGIGLCDIPHYAEGNMTEINVKVGDLLVMEFYTEEVVIMECYPARIATPVDYMAVVDFEFSLVWSTYGRSSYNSETGELVKEKYAKDIEEFTTTYFLSSQEILTVYKTLVNLEMRSYPDEYNPTEGLGSDPSETLILRAKIDRIDKTITATGVAFSDATSEKGQAFMDACRVISGIVTATEEWKALPEYPYLYE